NALAAQTARYVLSHEPAVDEDGLVFAPVQALQGESGQLYAAIAIHAQGHADHVAPHEVESATVAPHRDRRDLSHPGRPGPLFLAPLRRGETHEVEVVTPREVGEDGGRLDSPTA